MPTNKTLVRYLARLLTLWLGWLITVLSVSGATFQSLAAQGALIALLLLTAVWIGHVAQSFSDTGVLPEVPVAEKPPATVLAPLPDPPPPPVS